MRLTLIFNIIITTLPINAKPNLTLYDTLYVWAQKGLNLRIAPNKSSMNIRTLLPGDTVIVLENTDIFHRETMIDSNEFVKHPFILKSKWVKVQSKSDTGYVLNNYLLRFPIPGNRKVDDLLKYFLYTNNNFNTNIDTQFLYHSFKNELYGIKFNFVNRENILINYQSETGGEIYTLQIPKLNLGEAFVLIYFIFNNSDIDPRNIYEFEFRLLKNWKEELIFGVGPLLTIEIKMLGESVIITFIHPWC